MRRASPAVLLLALAGVLGAARLGAVDRFPQPEFESGYQVPETTTPQPRSPVLEYLDVAVLALALAISGWLAIRARSREGIFILGAFSIAYFGFFRRGCVCTIGSIQNVALALADPTYSMPVTVVAFFALPMVSTLLVGRSFCGGVCPFGALQDAVIVRPLRLPRWLTAGLGVLPVVYLGLAVLFAATGAEFVVCRFDPFVSFFRLGGGPELLALGTCFLALGTVVARPYCRFLCPYGLVLGWLSRLSLRHATISPDSCVQCRLCEDACPVDAIRPPTPALAAPVARGEKRALAAALLALPVLAALGGLAGSRLAPILAGVHPTVRLARQVQREDAGLTTTTTLESDAFRSTQATTAELTSAAAAVRRRFDTAGPILGAFVMVAITLAVLASFSRRQRTEYEMDRGECVSCGRCFPHCPREHLRLKGGGS